MTRFRAALGLLVVLAGAPSCRQETGRLSPEQEQRLAVVTRRSVLIHNNGKVGIEITHGSRGRSEVHRDGERVRISSGAAGSAETWSFAPPDDAEAWSQDIRGVILRAPQSTAGRQ